MLHTLKQKSLPEKLILFVLAVFFTSATMVELFHIPSSFQLLMDAGWCALGVMILLNLKKLWKSGVQVKAILAVVAAFFLSTVVGLALNYQPFLYYLWGLRNSLSYFVFFFACVLFLKAEDLDGYMKCLDILFVVNFVVSLYQFFVLGYAQDYLGGIFGVIGGCNRDSNVFLLIVVSYSVISYLNQKEKAWICLLKCAAALFLASLAELKMLILEFGAVLVLAVLMTKFSKRKIWLLIGGGIGAAASIWLLVQIFPWWAGWFSPASIWETATSAAGYNGQGIEVNRLTAIPIAWNTYLITWPQKLFGLGLGHCADSTISFLMTPFFLEYGHILYTWFYSGFLMMETGLVGVVLYCSVFAVVFFGAHSLERKGLAPVEYCQLAKIMSLMCLLLFFYNDSLRNYTAYLVFFSLALPFVKKGSE